MTDGLTQVQLRIAAIQHQLGVATGRAANAGSLPQSTTSNTDFAAVLENATATSSATNAANGRLPDSALVSIGGGERLVPTAAKAFNAMSAAAKTSGIAFGVNDSYRSYEEQVQVAKTKGLYSQGGLAAVPGTSTHGKGLSVDLELNSQAQSWMHANAARYGFVNDVRGEPWHWTYKG